MRKAITLLVYMMKFASQYPSVVFSVEVSTRKAGCYGDQFGNRILIMTIGWQSEIS